MTRFLPFRKKRNYTLPAIIILLALAVSLTSFGDLLGVRSLLISTLYPFQYVANAVWKGTVGFPAALVRLKNLSDENTELKEKLNSLLPRTALQEELVSENERLRAALHFSGGNRFGRKLLPAEVVGRGAAPSFSIITVNRGSASGVKNGMAAVTPDGLVGRVAETLRYSAKVMLITDMNSGVAAVDQRSRDLGEIEGYSLRKLVMKYVSTRGDVQLGDKIVTSSVSEIFPPGVPVGTVTRADKKEHDLFYRIEVEPAAKFSKLEELFLVF